jgi:hypothetical protein
MRDLPLKYVILKVESKKNARPSRRALSFAGTLDRRSAGCNWRTSNSSHTLSFDSAFFQIGNQNSEIRIESHPLMLHRQKRT